MLTFMTLKNRHIVIFILLSSIIFLGWGRTGHKIINKNATLFFPPQLAFLQDWDDQLEQHASDADFRKGSDPLEGPKHYIDIDNYPEFLSTGRISPDIDSLILLHGYPFVLQQGTLPWAIFASLESLQAAFENKQWHEAMLFASDLGHYVGDAHMPLHITRNYNGQFSNQDGIHSRYESGMIERYQTEINYNGGSVEFVADPAEYVFNFIYTNYSYVDSVLQADQLAAVIVGNTVSDVYFAKLWQLTGPFTLQLLENASERLASLIYTAWVNAGSPVPQPMEIYTVQQDSSLIGETVTVTGIVTAASGIYHPGRTFIEDPKGGPWSGILLWDVGANLVAQQGDEIRVTGEVFEYYNMTEILVSDYVILSTGNPLPPVEIVNSADLATGSLSAEPFESVLVQLNNVTIIDNNLGYGEWLVDDGSGVCRIDDDADSLFYQVPVNGTLLSSITGILVYDYDDFMLEPRYLADIDVIDSVVDFLSVPEKFELSQNFPNPFSLQNGDKRDQPGSGNLKTTIRYQIPNSSEVKLTVYDLLGSVVKQLEYRTRLPGYYDVDWDGRNETGDFVASGTYFYRIEVNSSAPDKKFYFEIKKMLLLK